jgi:hypothetical protein
MPATLHESPLSPEAWITLSTLQACYSSARCAGKSMRVRQWYVRTVLQHFGDLSQLVAQGVIPHSSTKSLLEACTLPYAVTQTLPRYFHPQWSGGSMTGIRNGWTKIWRDELTS